MRTFPSRNRIHVMLVWIVAGMLLGILFQTLRVALAPQLFTSTAKLTVINQPPRDSFADLVAETLQSPVLDRRSRERMNALLPELKACEIQVRAAYLGSGDLFQVTTAGTDPTYTRLRLDALLDEFLAFRQEMRGREEVGNRKPPPRDEVDAIQERATPAVMKSRDWLKPLLIGAGAGMLGGFALFYLISMGLALRVLLAPS